MKRLIWIVIIAVAAWLGYQHLGNKPADIAPSARGNYSHIVWHSPQTAFKQKQSRVQVGGSGTVVRVLPDDKGSRHQRFILRLAGGQTVLVAHNIKLAPRIKKLKRGDVVDFYGEYVWSEKGGVIHWTHHDPKGRHVDGWLRHQGVVYR